MGWMAHGAPEGVPRGSCVYALCSGNEVTGAYVDGWTYVRKLGRLASREFTVPKEMPYPFHNPEEYDRWFHETRIKPILEALPAGVGLQLQDIPVTLLPISSFNAHTLKAPNGQSVIVAHHGLQDIIQSYAETYLEATDLLGVYHVMLGMPLWLPFFQSLERHLEGDPKPLQDIRFRAFQARHSDTQTGETAYRIFRFDAISKNVELFVWLHEFAHAYLEHSASSAVESRTIAGDTSIEVSAYQHSQRQEFDADRQAFDWYLQIDRYDAGTGAATPRDESLPLEVRPRGLLRLPGQSVDGQREDGPEVLTPHQRIVSSLHFFVVARLVEMIQGRTDCLSTHPFVLERMNRLLGMVPTESRRGAEALSRVAVGLAMNLEPFRTK